MAAEFKIGRLRYTWAGTWAPGTDYSRDDVVLKDGKAYTCLIPNTSSTNFYTDLNATFPCWQKTSDGKTWTGTWSTGQMYGPGQIVIFGGLVYNCITSHTSTTFLADAANWTEYAEFDAWHPVWTTDTAYGLNDVVRWGGIVYKCIANHVSAASTTLGLEANIAAWAVYFSGVDYKGAWTASTRYKLNDLVKVDGNIYTCTQYHTSTSTFNSNNFSMWLPGQMYDAVWSSTTYYQKGDTVIYGGYAYISKTENNLNNFPSTSTANWSLFNVGYSLRGNWDFQSAYVPGELVEHGGVLFEAIANSSGQDPTELILTTSYISAGSSGNTINVFSSSNVVPGMTLVGTNLVSGQVVSKVTQTTASATGATFSGTALTLGGTVTGTFAVGMALSGNNIQSTYIVSGSGSSWVVSVDQGTVAATTINGQLNSVVLSKALDGALTDGQQIKFEGINSPYWTLLLPGEKWKNRWAVSTYYDLGDIVTWKNATYVATASHVSVVSPSLSTAPDEPSAIGRYWVILIDHDLNNSLNVQGDLRTFSNGKPDVLPITSTTGEIDTYVLGVSTDLPNWRRLNVIPAVYYVDTYSGLDVSHYGVTWDQPWKTIKYACNTIDTGFYFANTVTLLKANKAYMVAEMYQWMLYQMAQNISPFSTDSLWDANYAQRDAERIIDAIIYDLKRGGNSQTVAATLSFFYTGSKTQLYNSLVASSVVYYSPSLNYLLTLMQSVVTNTALTSYQTINNVAPTSVVYQVINNNLTAETGTATNISSLMNIITTALTNQNTYLVPSSNTGITATIYVKTGTYNEILPIIVPENVAIVGDELRSAVVQPATSKTIYCTQTSAPTNNPLTSNLMTVNSTIGLTDQMPLQFISPYVNNASTTFGGITSGQTYYVVGNSITNTTLQINDGPTFTFTGSSILNSNILSNVTSITNLAVGMKITGTGIPSNTYVYAFSQAVNSIATITLCTGYPLANGYSFVASNATSTSTIQTFTAAGNLVTFTDGFGNMTVYAGDCLKNMFLMRNGTTIRNMSFFGLKGTLTANNQYSTARPTGGAYTSLDPGNGPNDTRAWIIRKSPYIQNVTVFGEGASGIKIDGTLHNGGSKSIVSNDYTMVISDGIGIWCTGPGSITEAISVFSYYAYAGYFAEGGGRIRSANGNSSYGTFGVISEGYDLTEVPITGTINNQSQQVQASVVSAFGTSDQLLKLNYSNAGSGYYLPITNMLKWSNDFLTTWTNDANLSFIKNNTAPSGYTEAWLLTGSAGTPGTGYIQQSVSINPAGYNYTNIGGTTQDGALGTGATFDIKVTPTGYVVTVNNSGGASAGYQTGNNIKILGSVLGGLNVVNDLVIVVGDLGPGTGISTIASTSGTVPAGSSQGYTLSMYVYAGTSASVDLQAVFSGTTTVTSGVNYNVSSQTVTPYSGTSLTSATNGGAIPYAYGAQKTLVAGWYRVWLSAYDLTGTNTSLTYKFIPQGANAPIANTYSIIYGAQLEIAGTIPSPDFYLGTTTNRFSAYANYQVVGAGANALLSGDESRSQAIFNARIITDNNGFTGGAGYATSSNTAQDGNSYSIKLAATDIGLYNYLGMRVFVQSGTGAGQYGFISYYNNAALADSNGIAGKTALVLKDSVDTLTVTSSTYSATAANNLLTLAANTDVSTWYVNQAVQFIPTYYTTTATATSTDTVVATATVGGIINTITIPTESLLLNMPVTFAGTDFNITPGYQYYISDINYGSNTIQISATLSGNPIQLTTVSSGTMTMTYPRYSGYIKAPTANMVPNINIQFTGVGLGGLALGTNYYINDIIDSNNFTVSTTKVSLTTTTTTGGVTNTISATTASLIPLTPVVFGGVMFDSAIQQGTKYYISNIVDANNFAITTDIIRVSVTETEFGTNLITVSNVTNFIVGQPIIFSGIETGKLFGNIVPETVYYILTINPLNDKITISSDKVNPFTLTSRTGLIQARTCGAALSLGGGTGSMTITSTGTKVVVTNSVGNISTMNGTFSTSLFGNLNSYTIYYITALTPGTNPTLSISTTKAGTPITLATGVGNMQMAASGWDNITPGTASAAALDSTSAYYIEPRTIFSLPQYSQTTGTVATPLTGGASFNRIGFGNNYFMAIPTSGSVGAGSTDGLTWTSVTLPSAGSTWNDIAFGNSYWVALATTSGGGSIAAYSNSNGLGWRTSSLPLTSSWNKITYGNGTFVAISSNNTCAAYSTNHGLTWLPARLPGTTTFTVSGDASIQQTRSKFGPSSLYLDGTGDYVSTTTNENFGFGTGDFTIEGFFYATAYSTAQRFFDFRSTTSEIAIMVGINASNKVYVYVNGTTVITTVADMPRDDWTHVALSRVSGSTKLFINGVQGGSTYTDSNDYGTTKPLVIGADYSGANTFTGYVDEVRISKGIGRYTSLFTPTTTQFTYDSYTVLLMHLDDVATSTSITSTLGSWISLAYGSGLFVAINTTGQTAWSTDGVTWNSSTLPTSNTTLAGVTIIGSAGQFTCTTSTNTQLIIGQSIVVSGALTAGGGQGTITNGTYYISATNGKSSFTLADSYAHAIAGTNPITTGAGTTDGLRFAVGAPAYTSIAFGSNKFVAVQAGTGLRSALSFDGVNWIQSENYMSADRLSYGQGVFVAVNSTGTAAYVSEHGIYWKSRTLTYGSTAAMVYGITTTNVGVFATLTGDGSAGGNATVISEGARAQGRVTVSSGVITDTSLWETGSNYSSAPTVNLIDYNVSVNASITPRVGNGALSNPTFINRGTGYSTTSTVVTISGSGYADTFQKGLTLIINNLSSVPLVGSNLSIAGNNQVYKVTSASAVYGTTAPFIQANVQISPEMTTTLSPSHNAAVQLRQSYSQCRVTNHDFLLVGTGNRATANYPYTDITTAVVQNQAVETNQGHIFYSSTDENGNFSVGGLFGVQQATGTVTLSATQFGLTGLQTLSLGGIAVGSSSVVVNQFSTDVTFAANSDAIIPTQRAVKSYLTGRLSQGGANTYTGNFIAGTVSVGNPNIIKSTVANGFVGSSIKISNKMNLTGTKGIDGAMQALEMFMSNGSHKSDFKVS